ncbi:unnamed protein product, partial [Scytosiphon promiscuus]
QQHRGGVAIEARGEQRKREREGETRQLGVPTVTERETEQQLGRQISYLVEAVNTSGRRAAMLRALAESPLESVPRLEAQMLADEERLAAAAGVDRPPSEGGAEPWLDAGVCARVVQARADALRQENMQRALEADTRARAEQNARAEAAAARHAAQEMH